MQTRTSIVLCALLASCACLTGCLGESDDVKAIRELQEQQAAEQKALQEKAQAFRDSRKERKAQIRGTASTSAAANDAASSISEAASASSN